MDLVIAALLAVATAVGFAIAPLAMRREGLRRMATVLASGVLLGLLVTHLLPEAFATAPRYAPTFILAGFAGMMLLQQRVLRTDPCCAHEHTPHAALPALAALGLCATNDGILLAAENQGAGQLSPLLWGLLLHKFVAAFAFATLLNNLEPVPGRARRFAYTAAFVAISPLTYVGAALLVDWTGAIHAALAVAIGALLYVVVAGLLPQVEHHARTEFGATFGTFVLALALVAGLELALPSHEHGPGHAHGHAHGATSSHAQDVHDAHGHAGHAHDDRASTPGH